MGAGCDFDEGTQVPDARAFAHDPVGLCELNHVEENAVVFVDLVRTPDRDRAVQTVLDGLLNGGFMALEVVVEEVRSEKVFTSLNRVFCVTPSMVRTWRT